MFSSEEETKKMQDLKIHKFNNVDLTFEEYNVNNQRQQGPLNNFYLLEFFPQISEEEQKNFEEKTKHVYAEKLKHLLDTHIGKTTSVIVGKGTKEETQNKVYAFANFEKEESAKKFLEILGDKEKLKSIGLEPTIQADKQIPKKIGKETSIFKSKLLIRNIKTAELTPEQQVLPEEERRKVKAEIESKMQEEFKQILHDYGQIKSFSFKYNELNFQTNNPSLKSAYSCQVDFVSEEDSVKFITSYEKNKEFKKLF